MPRPRRPLAPPAPVVRVVDGDTLVVRVGGREETVRLIGIDTPESVDPRTPVQCFGREASARARRLLEGQQVHVETDPSQGERDQYGRLLAYVSLPDGDLVNLRLIAEGFAHEYTFDRPYRHQAAFREAERLAREQQRGLWSPATCAGDTNRPADAGGLAQPTSGGRATRGLTAVRAQGALPRRRWGSAPRWPRTPRTPGGPRP